MDAKVQESLNSVGLAMDGFNDAVEAWIEDLRQNDTGPDQILKLTGSAKAMRDSGSIYLAWAEHLGKGLETEDGLEPETNF